MASTVHLVKEDGFAPANRRISILVLTKQEEKKIVHENERVAPAIKEASEIKPLLSGQETPQVSGESLPSQSTNITTKQETTP